MSLFRQLWLTLLASTILAFIGSVSVSLLTARHYIEEELLLKNADNAAALALSMSQQAKDPVTISLFASALFNSGHYAEIRIVDPKGKLIVERVGSNAGFTEVPRWFGEAIDITSVPGRAQISDGWKQYGTITLVSHSKFAYRTLWRGTLGILAWSVAAAALTGLLTTGVLRRIRRPLRAVVAQAEAIRERRFLTIREPRTPELNSVAVAMNTTVARLREMFEEDASRLDQLRRAASVDALTGLANRRTFVNCLFQQLSREDSPPQGSVLLLRIADLSGLNRQLGRAGTDDVLQKMASVLRREVKPFEGAVFARMNGADFGILLPNIHDATALAARLIKGVESDLNSDHGVHPVQIHIGWQPYHHGETAATVLSQADSALAAAENVGESACRTLPREIGDAHLQSTADWQHLFERALQDHRFKLAIFPVCDFAGTLLHQEALLRIQNHADGAWLPAGYFLPVAARLLRTSELDLAALALALKLQPQQGGILALNIAIASVRDPAFVAASRRLCAGKRGNHYPPTAH